jgi:hypothetical protein
LGGAVIAATTGSLDGSRTLASLLSRDLLDDDPSRRPDWLARSTTVALSPF